MICLLCLDDSKEGINLFTEDGLNMQIAEIVSKHFWIKPDLNDPTTITTCISCWLKVEAFHTFYQTVEEAHKHHAGLLELECALKDDSSVGGGYDGDVMKEDPSGDDSDDWNDRDVEIPKFNFLEGIKHEICDEPAKVDPIEDKKPELPEIVVVEDTAEVISPPRRGRSKAGTDETPIKVRAKKEDKKEDSIDEDNSDSGKKRRRGRPRKGSPPKESPAKKPPSQKTELSKEYDALIAKHMKLNCVICCDLLTDFSDLKRHFRQAHQMRGYAVCCNKKFLKRGVLVDHINVHLNPEHFKCTECDKILADRRCLDVHMDTHKEEQKRIYQCDECPKNFFKKMLLTRHKLIHVPESARHFKCEDCHKLYPSMYALKSHRNNVHDNAYTKICDICGKTVRSKNALKRHLMEHDGILQPEVQCDKCGLKVTNKYSLKRHTTLMHSDFRKPQTCDICGKVAPNPQALRRHYDYVHTCSRQHKCSVCDKAFKKATTLKEHMTTHTGEVLYTCPHCPKTFNSNANMHSHRKKVHRKEWEENRRRIRPFAHPEDQSILAENHTDFGEMRPNEV